MVGERDVMVRPLIVVEGGCGFPLPQGIRIHKNPLNIITRFTRFSGSHLNASFN